MAPSSTSANPVRPAREKETRHLQLPTALTVLTGLGLLTGVVLSFTGAASWLVVAAYGVAYLAGGLPATGEALASLRRGELDIDLLMVVAALAAAAVGEARDGAILLFLFSLAETLEEYALGRTERAVSGLMALRPDTAHLKGASGTEKVPVERLEPGDIVLVKPGERIPVDGEVVQGSSAVDQATITGESVPVDKNLGDAVFAATVNGYGALEIRVGKRASESTLARMIELVTEAQSQRSPSQRFSDWFGQRYTVFVLVGSAVALGVFFALGMPREAALYKAATLLVVASPCAVVISVPAAVLSGLAAAARGGVLFKGGAALEDFGNVTVVALDKTGTLTYGKPRLTDTHAFGEDTSTLLRLAASAEAQSEHPIAQSVVGAAGAQGVALASAEAVRAVPGEGVVATVEGRGIAAGNRKLMSRLQLPIDAPIETVLNSLEEQGKTVVIVADTYKRRIIGVLAVADTLRGSAREAIAGLRSRGVERIVMLTGDHHRAARHIAATLGLSESDVYADLLPEDKVRLVRELRRKGGVAFVGDGVNDAAALASADVGVAMGTAGSDAALEAADVALLSDELTRLRAALELAQRANRVVRQNLFFSVGAMSVLVVLTLFGNLPLPLGVVGHEGGTLVVVGNGLRLLSRGCNPESRQPSASTPVPASTD